MSWNYRLDTPMMQLAEEVNKKYDTDAGKMLLCTYLFMVSSEEVKDKQAFFDWVEELSKSCKCDAVREYVKSTAKPTGCMVDSASRFTDTIRAISMSTLVRLLIARLQK